MEINALYTYHIHEIVFVEELPIDYETEKFIIVHRRMPGKKKIEKDSINYWNYFTTPEAAFEEWIARLNRQIKSDESVLRHDQDVLINSTALVIEPYKFTYNG